MRVARLVVVTAALAGCGGDNGGGTPPGTQVASVSVSPSTVSTMKSIGDAVQLTATVRDANDAVINNPTVSWSSSSNAVISLSPTSGLAVTATAVGNGSANVTATSGGKASAPVGLTVQQELASVGFSPTALSVAVNETKTLTVNGRDARGNTIASGITLQSFLSRNEAVATVAQGSGTSISVTGVADGTAVVVATLAQGSITKTDSTVVTVAQTPPPPVGVTASVSNTFVPSSVTIDPGVTVNWTFEVLHNVTFYGGSAPPGGDIPDRSSGTVGRTFTTSGTYGYVCTIHGAVSGGSCSGMCGTVAVR